MNFEQMLDGINQTPTGTTGQQDARRAALMLHALEPEDQRKLLSALPAMDRARMTELLEELVQLKIPPDFDLVQTALRPANMDSAGLTPNLQQLTRAQADAVIAVLVEEADIVIAMVLRIGDWPWKPELLLRLGAVRSQGVLRQLAEKPQAALAPGVRQSLLQTLTDVAANAPLSNGPTSGAPNTPVRAFLQRVREMVVARKSKQ